MISFAVSVIEPAGYKYSHFLYDLCKYICYSIESSGNDCCIQRNKITTDKINIIVGAHNQTDPSIIRHIRQAGPYILLQTEVIRGDSINNWNNQKAFAEVYLPLMRQATAVWTGSQDNIEALKKLDVNADLLQWGYHPLMEEIRHKKNKDIDFLFCGSISEHRKHLLDRLAAYGCKLVTMFDDAAMYRNDLIARARVNVAPNHGPGLNHLGKSRVLYMVNNRAVVVVEKCFDQAMYEHCFPWAETDHWVDLCMETLRRPDLHQAAEDYYERFKKIPMSDFMGSLIEKFIDRLPQKSALKAEQVIQSDIERPDQERPLFQPCETEPSKGLTSIIIVTRNRLDETKKCVKSIRKHTPEDHEIIFVDNGSTDNTVRWLQSQIRENKNYRLIANQEDIGRVRGRNQGIAEARGEYILLLDNDVTVSEGWLSGMLECLHATPDTGLVGPMTNEAANRQQLSRESDFSAHRFESFASEYRNRYRNRRIYCRNLTGFCLLFKRSLGDRIGLPDERFNTTGFDDEDFCWRTTLADYRNVIAGDVVVCREPHGKPASDRKEIKRKWTLSMATPEGKKLALLRATELADAFYAKGNLDQAVETLVNCIKYAPDEPLIYFELARLFIEGKKYAEARDVVTSMPQAAQDAIKGLECAACAREGLGLDDEAAVLVEKMLSLHSQYPPAINLLGVLSYKKGDKEKAKEFFQQAIEADPGYGEAYTNLGVLYWGIEQREEAFGNLKKGFLLSPALPDASSLYYSVVSSLDRFSQAEDDFAEACRLHPQNKNLVFLYIDILIQQEKFDSAILRIQDALTTFGLDEGTLNAALAVRDRVGPLQIEKSGKKGTLSLCMIVKNEEKHLAKCLKSVRDVVDEIIIVDTGSTDKTKDIAKVFGAKLYDFPWTGDFSAARNESLKSATGDWVFVLDADEVISSLDRDQLRKEIQRAAKPAAFIVRTRNYTNIVSVVGWTANTGEYPEEVSVGWVKSDKIRIFSRQNNIFFTNPVHELLENSVQKAKVPILKSKVVVHHYGKLDAACDDKKGQDYYMLGKIKYESDPNNVKYIYELAKQAQVLKKNEEAVDLWQKLLPMVENNRQSADYKELASISFGEPVAEIYMQLASAYIDLNLFEEALASARKSIETPEPRTENIHIYAHCEIIAGAPERALTAIETLLGKNNPDNIPAQLMKAIACSLQDKKNEAQDLYSALLKKGATITANLNKLAGQMKWLGRKEAAQKLIDALFENKLNNEETAKLRAELE